MGVVKGVAITLCRVQKYNIKGKAEGKASFDSTNCSVILNTTVDYSSLCPVPMDTESQDELELAPPHNLCYQHIEEIEFGTAYRPAGQVRERERVTLVCVCVTYLNFTQSPKLMYSCGFHL